jgi:hypothetical protein
MGMGEDVALAGETEEDGELAGLTEEDSALAVLEADGGFLGGGGVVRKAATA